MNIKSSLVLAVLAAGIVSVGCGTNLRDFVRVKTPARIQQDQNLPATMPLTQAESEHEIWRDTVRRQDREWQENLRQGDAFANVLSNVTLQFLTVGEGAALAAAPWAGPLLPLGMWAVGAFVTKRPGDVSKDEVDKTWDEAFAQGKAMGLLQGNTNG